MLVTTHENLQKLLLKQGSIKKYLKFFFIEKIKLLYKNKNIENYFHIIRKYYQFLSYFIFSYAYLRKRIHIFFTFTCFYLFLRITGYAAKLHIK